MESLQSKFEGHSDDYTSDISYDEARNLVGRGLIGKSADEGDPYIRWMTDFIPCSTQEERWATVAFIMGFPINQEMKNGSLLIGQKVQLQKSDKNSGHKKDDDKDFLRSCLIVREHQISTNAKTKSYLSSLSSFWQSAMAFYQMTKGSKIPDLFMKRAMSKHRSHFIQTASITDKLMKEWHIQFGPKEPHWYLFNVVVDPDYQNKKIGTRLMGLLNDEADRVGKTIFLVCASDRSKAFFGRLDYKQVATEQIVDPSDSARKCQLYFMIRQPSS